MICESKENVCENKVSVFSREPELCFQDFSYTMGAVERKCLSTRTLQTKCHTGDQVINDAHFPHQVIPKRVIWECPTPLGGGDT